MRAAQVEERLRQTGTAAQRAQALVAESARRGNARHARLDADLAGLALRVMAIEAAFLAVVSRLDALEAALTAHAADKKGHH